MNVFVLTVRNGGLIIDRNDTIIKINNDLFITVTLRLRLDTSTRCQNNQEQYQNLRTPRIHGGLTKNFVSRRYL